VRFPCGVVSFWRNVLAPLKQQAVNHRLALSYGAGFLDRLRNRILPMDRRSGIACDGIQTFLVASAQSHESVNPNEFILLDGGLSLRDRLGSPLSSWPGWAPVG